MSLLIGVNNFDSYGQPKLKFSKTDISDHVKAVDADLLALPKGQSYKGPSLFRRFAHNLCGIARVSLKISAAFIASGAMAAAATWYLSECFAQTQPPVALVMAAAAVGADYGGFRVGYKQAKKEENVKYQNFLRKERGRAVIDAWTKRFNVARNDTDLIAAKCELEHELTIAEHKTTIRHGLSALNKLVR